MTKKSFVIDKKNAGKRIDCVICDALQDLTRNAVQKLIESGGVTVCAKKIEKNYKTRPADIVEITIPDPIPLDTKAEDIDIDVVYEDNDLLVVNKPSGMVVHPAAGNYSGTLVNALLSHCGNSLSGINGVIRPGIVHRIDKDTSGLLIVAKNNSAHLGLAAQIKQHSFTRIYEAIVVGNIKNDIGQIEAPIGRNKNDRKKMCVTTQNSKPAKTSYKVIQRLNGFTHIECQLFTGRTHQIRVHMAYIGHPVAGDPVYGRKNDKAEKRGQYLHARTIGFVHPSTGEYMEFCAPLPQDFIEFINKHKA